MYYAPLTLLVLACVFGSYIICKSNTSEGFSISENHDRTIGFNWSAITARSHLNYTACYAGFECARLEVPLDWTNASNYNKVQLAVIRLPALVSETDPSYGGTILFNPGGPGGSGIDVMRWTGHGIRNVVDSDKHFELISWDPRGIHHTTPSLSCFDDDLKRNIWIYRNNVIGPMDGSNVSLTERWALARSFGKLCEQTQHGSYLDGSSIAQFATTALVARDMLEIIDQVEVRRSHLPEAQYPINKQQAQLTPKSPALLNYWGYSYGSYLGNTFASMFPSRIGRMAMDSVVDTDDYTATAWFSNLQDFHKALDFFYKDCFTAGSLCPLNDFDVVSPEDIASKIEKLLSRLKSDPYTVLHEGTPDIVTFADVSSLLFATMYFPTWSWPELAQILADLIQGNGTSMISYLQQVSIPTDNPTEDKLGQLLLQGRNKTDPYPPVYPSEGEAGRAVMCGDGDDLTNLTVDEWSERLARWRSQSPIAGWRWSENPLLCAHWPTSFRPAERNRFKGPWSSKLADYDSRASPLLFIAGTGDPVLPLRNAYKSAARHEGAHVLIQDAPGHCTGYINPSKCTWRHIKRFFADGVLPENSTTCLRDGTPWVKW